MLSHMFNDPDRDIRSTIFGRLCIHSSIHSLTERTCRTQSYHYSKPKEVFLLSNRKERVVLVTDSYFIQCSIAMTHWLIWVSRQAWDSLFRDGMWENSRNI